MGRDVGQIFPTASLHRDHSISYALVCERKTAYLTWAKVGERNFLHVPTAYLTWAKVGEVAILSPLKLTPICLIVCR